MAHKGCSKRTATAVNPFRLAELRSIVGPSLDDASLSHLLKRSDGVIEKAVNFYFDAERDLKVRSDSASGWANSAVTPDHSTARASKSQKLLNGEAQESSECNRTGKTLNQDEMQLGHEHRRGNAHFVRPRTPDWPKFLGTINVMGYTTEDLDAERLPGNTPIFVSRRVYAQGGSKGNKSTMGLTKRSEKKDYILRWKIVNEESKECGRLPAEVSKPIAILLDAGWLEVDGCTMCEPDSSRKFANVPLSLNIRINCFSAPSALSEDTDPVSRAPHEALIRLLKILNYVPRIPSELDMCSECAPEADCVVSQESPRHLNHTRSGTGEVDEEGRELSNEHFDILFNEADTLNCKLLEDPQPDAMRTVLRDYQRQGLWWLRQREIKRVHMDDERELLHPLWAEYRLPDDTPLYVKPIGSVVSIQRPSASSRGLGGILSDEMGLGKTVQLLALCSLDKPFSRKEASNPVHAPVGLGEGMGVDGSLRPTVSDSILTLEESSETEGSPVTSSKVEPGSDVDKGRESRSRLAENMSDVVDLTSEDSWIESSADHGISGSKEGKMKAGLSHKDPLAKSASAHALHVPSLRTRLINKDEPRIVNGGTLVICPMSILGQWEDEIASHVHPGHLRVVVHYGGDRTLSAHVLSRPDIVLTTYGVLSAEYIRLGQSNGRATLFAIDWHRIILDEAHYIKGRHTQVTQAVFALKGERRWAVTGTPVQNKLDDLFPLLHFIQLEPWSEISFWQKHVIRPFEELKDVNALKKLHKALQPLLLRRTKESKDSSGNPLLSLPRRSVEVVELDFSVQERDFYDVLFAQSKTRFEAYVAAGKVMNNYASILEMLLRLRQCCAHPYLILSSSNFRYLDNPELNRMALRLSGSPSACLDDQSADCKDMDETQDAPAQECPICLESVEDPVVTPCSHTFCRECINDAIRRSGGTLCPSCRTPVSRSELTSTEPLASRSHFNAELNWLSSTKIDFLLQDLLALKTNESKEIIKSVVFSQWTGMLDLVEIGLRRAGIAFTRLDGSMSQQQRAENVAAFSSSPKVNVLLISLKAGGVGINLTAASYVFLLDMWWNPAVDEQAIARVHRMGQTRSVVVKKLVIRSTVEQRVIQLQALKKLLVQGALGMNREEASALRMHDLHQLFA